MATSRSRTSKSTSTRTTKAKGSSTKVLKQVEELLDVVNKAVEGDYTHEMPVEGDDTVGQLAGGLQSIFGDVSNYAGQVSAISKSQAVIEFELDGTIITANENFCGAVGYTLEEIQGKHHRIFVDADYAATPEYKQFWNNLGDGNYDAGEYKRFRKDGTAIWIQASYNPIFDESGKPFKVVKYASDITGAKMQTADYEGQLSAIGKSQAVIEFELDGTIITANENFCNALGYSLREIEGQHHRMFVDREYGRSREYMQFWEELGHGDFKSGEFERFTRDGSSIWIQASYNPIFDPDGKPYKVVKYASDITTTKMQAADWSGQLEAIGKSQAVIEFELDGTIITANENFLTTLGYSLPQIEGQHHRMFVAPDHAGSAEYRQFWADLAAGQYKAGEFCRYRSDGSAVWIQASYNPICDPSGTPYKVVKYAVDVTDAKVKSADYEGQLEAISKAQAVIEFELDGTIVTANENFLATLGYTLPEVQGAHHRMFVAPDFASSPAYAQLWRDLANGQFHAGEFERFHKDGSSVWIQASYNPIFGPDGKAYKVVKYATNITEQKLKAVEAARVKSMVEQAPGNVMFADLDLIVQYMNPASLKTLRSIEQHLPIRADEVVGQCIDIFHKNPSHQRRILADPSSLPIESQIQVGPETLSLLVSAIMDEEGNYVGPMVNWEVITEKLALEQSIKDKAEEERVKAESDRQKVEQMLDAVQRFGSGDPSAEITVTGDDALGQLAEGLRSFFVEKRAADERLAAQAERERQEAEDTQRKVDTILQIVNSVAEGKFDVEFPDLGQDAIGRVSAAMSSAVGSVRDALIEVREVSGTVATASTEMTSAAEEISRGAQQQAARLEETASSLEEITNTVKQNSENAQEARSLANGSRDIATNGGDVVGDAVQAMREINDSSKRIADIITTIDEIAFQTNLLALNAAVEAARAGEQGRGFAVVAAEVRNLAQRSASSAKEIKGLIQDSNSKVEKGTELVNKSGETLGEIVESVKRVTDIVSEIAAASTEQLSAIEGVTGAVTQMDEVTQASASQTEELTGDVIVRPEPRSKPRADGQPIPAGRWWPLRRNGGSSSGRACPSSSIVRHASGSIGSACRLVRNGRRNGRVHGVLGLTRQGGEVPHLVASSFHNVPTPTA